MPLICRNENLKRVLFVNPLRAFAITHVSKEHPEIPWGVEKIRNRWFAQNRRRYKSARCQYFTVLQWKPIRLMISVKPSKCKFETSIIIFPPSLLRNSGKGIISQIFYYLSLKKGCQIKSRGNKMLSNLLMRFHSHAHFCWEWIVNLLIWTAIQTYKRLSVIQFLNFFHYGSKDEAVSVTSRQTQVLRICRREIGSLTSS